jgi:hypothetical protein
MGPTEVAGIVALAIVVVREAFSMVRGLHQRRNGNSDSQRLKSIESEILRLRDRTLKTDETVTTLKAWVEMIREQRP